MLKEKFQRKEFHGRSWLHQLVTRHHMADPTDRAVGEGRACTTHTMEAATLAPPTQTMDTKWFLESGAGKLGSVCVKAVDILG
ncbi:hypothetical protein GUJ93_ZPchr0003g18620 [Zizania palustris]|uniref:Uncharacterized protein n=1 Tax=Zizania palustris TaxID=103762 RepID=A0A8J5S8L9_ZIZPA|nr:hypothetical protein GUJ93_ZPchr0003g18620 [Zizania palustris]